MHEIHGTSVLILGFGREGQSVYRFIKKNAPEIRIAVADQKPIMNPPDDIGEALVGKDYLTTIHAYDTVVRSPGIPLLLPELKNARFVTTATNLFFANCPGKIIGVTGTKGKSTTSSLIHALLSAHLPDVRLVGNIGIPALDTLEGATGETVFIDELSSFQLADIRYSPQIAVLLAIHHEHLDLHGSHEAYLAAKTNSIRYQSNNDVVVYNPAHGTTKQIAEESKARKKTFSLKKIADSTAWVENDRIMVRRHNTAQTVLTVDQLPVKGIGNVENTLAALVVANEFNIPIEKIIRSVRSFRPLPNRLQTVGTYRGITFVNDSAATTPEAAINALETFGDKVTTLIVGGSEKGHSYAALGDYISNNSNLQTLIIFPTTGAQIAAAVKHPIRIIPALSMKEAIETAYQYTPENSVCLLSPAAASFSLFRDYVDRGEQFSRYAKELA